MVLVLDGNSEIGAHVWSDLDYLICLRLVYIEGRHKPDLVLSEKTYFPSYVRSMLWVTL